MKKELLKIRKEKRKKNINYIDLDKGLLNDSLYLNEDIINNQNVFVKKVFSLGYKMYFDYKMTYMYKTKDCGEVTFLVEDFFKKIKNYLNMNYDVSIFDYRVYFKQKVNREQLEKDLNRIFIEVFLENGILQNRSLFEKQYSIGNEGLQKVYVFFDLSEQKFLLKSKNMPGNILNNYYNVVKNIVKKSSRDFEFSFKHRGKSLFHIFDKIFINIEKKTIFLKMNL